MTHSEHTSASPSRTALAPDTARLDPRAARAWTQRMAVTAVGDGRYLVDSESGNRYVVDLPAGRCTCPDRTIRGQRCKHIRRVAIEITRERVPSPGRRGVVCAACDRRAFVPEDGVAVCSDCHRDRGTPVRDRRTGDLLIVVEQTADRADAVTVDDSGDPVTVADYPTNRGYPPDDPVVYAVYPFSGRALEDRDRYAFPHARLAPARPSD